MLGWQRLRWVTTRQARTGADDRIFIDSSEFQRLADNGQLFYRFDFFGAQYGLRVADVDGATGDARIVFATDVLPTRLWAFSGIDRTVIAVVAESDRALEKRLADAGRSERRAEAIREQRLILESATIRRAIDACLVCRTDELSAAVADLGRLHAECRERKARS